MANNQQSVFMPVKAEDLEGPFSGALRPPDPTATPASLPAPVGTAGGIAMAASKFLEGAAKGRIKAYEERENAKLQKLNQLNQYMSNVYPTLTPDGQKQAMQLYSRALGPEVLSSIDGGGKGKGGKKGEDGGGGAAHHFTNILKDVALGMAGGKMPKGAPDMDLHSVIGNIALIGNDPKYSREGVINTNLGNIKQSLQGFEGTQEEALQRIAPHLQSIEALDPQRANAARADYLGGYRPAPPTGSPADVASHLLSGGGRPPAGPPPGSSAPPEPVRGSAPQPGTTGFLTQGLTPDAAPEAGRRDAGPPQQPTFDRTRAILHEYGGLGSIGKPQDVEVAGPDGKTQRTSAYHVNNSEFSGWISTDTNKPIEGSVRIASTAEPRERKTRYDKAYPGKDGKPHSVTLDAVTGEIIKDQGVTPKGAGVDRPAFSHQSSPQVKMAQRKLNVMEAMSKVLNQTPPPKDASGAPLRGMAEAQYYLDHIRQYYSNDKSVAPFSAEIKEWLVNEAHKESFKEPGDVKRLLQEATGKAQGEAQNQQQLDTIRQSVAEGMSELWGAPVQAPTQQDPEDLR